MTTFSDLKNFFKDQDFTLIMAADGEPVVSRRNEQGIIAQVPAGGVSIVLDAIGRATNATYIARAKSEEERKTLDRQGKMLVGDADGNYVLKRLFFNEQDADDYYAGFSNQTLWPLCHVAFEQPLFNPAWYEGYTRVNVEFAKAIKKTLRQAQGKRIVWIHDYQLALVPSLLGRQKDTLIAMFWHIPWPTWEVFRILPQKKEILTSLLACDFLAFHRGYQARNFLETVERELEARIDYERQQVHFKEHITTVKSLPLGIDTDSVRLLVPKETQDSPLARTIKAAFGIVDEKEHPLDWYFEKYKVIFGVDRLDYTKGIRQRLEALDVFFEKNPQYRGKAIYLGIIAPSREQVDSYKRLKKELKELASRINAKYETRSAGHSTLRPESSGSDSKSSGQAMWQPIRLINGLFSKEEVLNFFRKAHLCLVTPLDDGMNLVSKEFVISASLSADPGMLVLSQFAGSAIDLGSSLIINPYDIKQVAEAIKQGLEMDKEEKIKRVKRMTEMLDENNVYSWGLTFLREALLSGRH